MEATKLRTSMMLLVQRGRNCQRCTYYLLCMPDHMLPPAACHFSPRKEMTPICTTLHKLPDFTAKRTSVGSLPPSSRPHCSSKPLIDCIPYSLAHAQAELTGLQARDIQAQEENWPGLVSCPHGQCGSQSNEPCHAVLGSNPAVSCRLRFNMRRSRSRTWLTHQFAKVWPSSAIMPGSISAGNFILSLSHDLVFVCLRFPKHSPSRFSLVTCG